MSIALSPLPMDGKGFTPEPLLPVPQGWMLLVKPYKTPRQIGSIHVPESRSADEDLASPLAQVVAMGPDAYTGDKFPSGPRCKVGDYVIFATYTGQKFKVGDPAVEYRLICDDDVKATVVDPTIIRRDL